MRVRAAGIFVLIGALAIASQAPGQSRAALRERSAALRDMRRANCRPAFASCFDLPPGEAHLRALLRTQGFGTWLGQGAHLERVGVIRTGGSNYTVYNYVNFYLPLFMDHPHSMTRTVFVRNGRFYVGSYSLDDEPSRIDGRDVVFDIPRDQPLWQDNRIHVGPKGPPPTVEIGGDYVQLAK